MDQRPMPPMDTNALLYKVLNNSAEQMRKDRRERRIFAALKYSMFAILAVMVWVLGENGAATKGDKSKPHVAYIEIFGPIMSGQLADADRLVPALEEAFQGKNVKAVALKVNSPGGSPVHAGRLYDEIRYLETKYPEIPVYAVIEDLGASAAYYISSATQTIYVDKASMVGSIGVISESFGFNEIMNKVGIERRVMTSGAKKALLDPFSPSNPEVNVYWQAMLGDIHQQFIAAVKQGRGDRLKSETPDLFSGLIWTGEKSIEIGLADKLGSLTDVSREVVGSVNLVNYTPSPDFLKQLSNKTQAAANALKFELLAPQLF